MDLESRQIESMEPDYLAKCYPDEREKNIEFYADEHKYIICGDPSYISVTTFVHRCIEEFDADKIIAKMMSSKKWCQSKYYGMTVDEIKAGWDKNRDEASSAGTKLHYDIECFYNEIDNKNDSVEWSYFMKFKEDFGHLVPYRTELKVYHEELKLVGTIDMLFLGEDNNDAHMGQDAGIKGVSPHLLIYDWKRSKEIVKTTAFNKWMKPDCLSHLPDTNFWHYSLQLNIYKAIIELKYGKKVDGIYLVCLHPNNKNGSYQRIRCADLSEEVAVLFEERRRELSIV
jgi:uncharacterized protein (UPF0297 family)